MVFTPGQLIGLVAFVAVVIVVAVVLAIIDARIRRGTDETRKEPMR